MAAEGDLQRMIEAAWDKRNEWAREQPSLSSELKSLAREALKDIRVALVDQAYFGHYGGHGEPGTPLNPMYAELTRERGILDKPLDVEGPQQSYEQQVNQASQQKGPDADRGISL